MMMPVSLRSVTLALVCEIAAAVAVFGGATKAGDPNPMLQRPQIEAIIHEYLLQHPDVLIAALRHAKDELHKDDVAKASQAGTIEDRAVPYRKQAGFRQATEGGVPQRRPISCTLLSRSPAARPANAPKSPPSLGAPPAVLNRYVGQHHKKVTRSIQIQRHSSSPTGLSGGCAKPIFDHAREKSANRQGERGSHA
jgi:hypothetical protein